MKRVISIIMILVMLMSMPTVVYAVHTQDARISTEIENNMLDYLQSGNNKLLILRQNYGYMTFVEEFKSNELALYLLEMSDLLIDTGAEPDTQKYIEVLTNIIATYELDNASIVAEQCKLDNLKSFKDYAMDFAEMGEKAVAIVVGNSSTVTDLEEGISTAVSALSTLADNTDNWIEALSNLEVIVQNYSKYDEFLELIEENAEGDLEQAANIIRNGMKSAIKIKLDTYGEVSDENFENYSEFFYSDDFFKVVKEMPEYSQDENLKYFVDTGDDFVSKAEILEASWELGLLIGTLVGDVTVGAEDLINRYLEMMAIYDISIILQDKLIDLESEFLNSYGNDVGKSVVDTYILYSQYLVGCRIRGEYCVYSITANDAGLLSWFNKDSAEAAKEWYENKVENILSIQSVLIKIIDNSVQSLDIGTYQYSKDDFVAELYVSEIDGEKNCYWSAWYNYGDSASVEDFEFTWSDGQHNYEVVGQRTKQVYDLNIEIKDDYIIIDMVCADTDYSLKAEYKLLTDNRMESDEISTLGEPLVLSKEEQYRINIFLSNFSEQWFHESSPEEFESENADPMDMIEFACIYLKLNGDDTVEFLMHNDYSYAGFSIEAINSVTQRFFNRIVTLEEIVPVQLFDDYYNYIVLDDLVCFAWGDGETYNNMTVTKEIYDLGNGTMQVKFNIYSINVDNYNLVDIGGGIKDKSVYYYTQTDAEAHSDFEFHLSGVAVVKPYIASNGKETYQLISYELKADAPDCTELVR